MPFHEPLLFIQSPETKQHLSHLSRPFLLPYQIYLGLVTYRIPNSCTNKTHTVTHRLLTSDLPSPISPSRSATPSKTFYPELIFTFTLSTILTPSHRLN